ncbi:MULTISPECIES: T3SS (YopN, CesT) and YbjN peptide-binding chaperone 1 [unclassified Nocardioides]|uniref:T3SS (YopN, CesT) and YbjN peptide-binding chaperone 1 n=1 Tax=unclassified Nocardioides TaxID=2615069 RepID=UPI0006FB2562|nr:MULTISPECIES: hypothetical protein [unclassified Nocardioides]KRA37920.1 hypothetical protein ASD81_04340 [Nocardioides sp. Root614]KRA91880.1 hypothetical protein ASD84_04605 [Nocardioides sp. Root682]
MTNTNHGGTPADEAHDGLDAGWEELADSLATYLSMMVDPDEGDHLLIELTDPDPDGDAGCPPYAQFAAFGDGRMIRAEVSGNAYLRTQFRLGSEAAAWFTGLGWVGGEQSEAGDVEEGNWHIEMPVECADEIVGTVVQALRQHFGIPHPQLLTYQAWGPAADEAEFLWLCATGDVPIDEPTAAAGTPSEQGREPVLGQLALEPADREELVAYVASVLREKYEAETTLDDDGDFVLHHLGQPVWVRVRSDQPAVEIIARVAHDVHSRRSTAVEVGLLNRDSAWAKWDLRDRDVWQTLLLPGVPFVPRHLDAMLDVFLDAMTSTRDDLAYRTGAKVA